MGRAPWRLLGHTADIRVELSAPSFPGLCAAGALALSSLATDRRLVRSAAEKVVPIPDGDPEEAFLPFMRSALLLLSADRFLARSATPRRDRSRDAGGWEVVLRGEGADARRHRFNRELKAVTRHAFELFRTGGGGWRARFVVDV